MRVCHFEDVFVADLEPLSLTRAAFDLLSGCTTLAEKQLRRLVPQDVHEVEVGALVRPWLADSVRQTHADMPVNDLEWLREDAVCLVNSRWLPPAPSDDLDLRSPCLGVVDDQIAWAMLPATVLRECSLLTLSACLKQWLASYPAVPAGGRLIRRLWELVDTNSDEITLDAWLADPERTWNHSLNVSVIGSADRLFVDPAARIDPFVIVDTTNGPVVIERDAVISSFSRLEGPCWIGQGSQILGAKIRSGTSIGPACRIGGEVEASIIQGWTNKYHDGFLGHAYIGEWVNLGAGASNSDLRNDYGNIRVMINERLVDTGRNKIGCYLGDHTKVGLGTLLNCGTNAGAFSNLLPTGGLLPRFVPSFTNVINGVIQENEDVEGLLRTAKLVMRRRGRTLQQAQEELYRRIWQLTAETRQRVTEEAQVWAYRQSA